MNHVVDASVWMADIRPSDVNHTVSAAFFLRVRNVDNPLFEPTLVLAECAGAISRTTQSPRLGAAAVAIIEVTRNLTLIDLTVERAKLAAQIAAGCAIRGADAVYVAVAQEFGASLITWDNEMLARAPAVVPTMTPSDWLAANPV